MKPMSQMTVLILMNMMIDMNIVAGKYSVAAHYEIRSAFEVMKRLQSVFTDAATGRRGDQMVLIVEPLRMFTTRTRPLLSVRWISSPWTMAPVKVPPMVRTVEPFAVLTMRTELRSSFAAYAMTIGCRHPFQSQVSRRGLVS